MIERYDVFEVRIIYETLEKICNEGINENNVQDLFSCMDRLPAVWDGRAGRKFFVDFVDVFSTLRKSKDYDNEMLMIILKEKKNILGDSFRLMQSGIKDSYAFLKIKNPYKQPSEINDNKVLTIARNYFYNIGYELSDTEIWNEISKLIDSNNHQQLFDKIYEYFCECAHERLNARDFIKLLNEKITKNCSNTYEKHFEMSETSYPKPSYYEGNLKYENVPPHQRGFWEQTLDKVEGPFSDDKVWEKPRKSLISENIDFSELSMENELFPKVNIIGRRK